MKSYKGSWLAPCLSRSLSGLALVGVAFAPWAGAAELAAPFGDRMVVQRNEPIRVWGTAARGDTVAVELNGSRAAVVADDGGQWSAQIDALPAGGPFELSVESAGRTQTVRDVMVGDVFLCSGQSNMEMPVVRALDSWSEVHRASNDRIRMTKIGRAAVATPRTAFPAPLMWQAATSETVGDWSAVCYFFARELQKHVDVPIGLIDASWGGSDVRAWMDAASLAEVGDYGEMLDLLSLFGDNQSAAHARFGELWQSWWRREASGGEPWQPDAGVDWTPAPEGLGNWKEWNVPELESFDGMVWYRATAELTAEQAARDATLVLGGVDEVDQTWINGHVLGNTFGWGDERRYEVPADWLREGENVVVSNIFSAWDFGGLVGDGPRELRLGGQSGEETVPLTGWRFRMVENPKEPPRAPWESIAGRTTLYNAMIAPLRDLPIRAALWYQGESNTAQGLDYQPLLEAMISGWRRQFGDHLPFLVVQLASFGRRSIEPTESGLANVREAQRRVARDDPRTALVTAVDVGDVYDVHPPNKQEVGRRLARAARHLVYGEDVTPSGPWAVGATRQGDAVRIAFDDVVGELVAHGFDRPIGFELCGARCEYAEARIDGDAVMLEEAAGAERVRYCWADSPVCTLYDGAGFPAIPFELSIETGN